MGENGELRETFEALTHRYGVHGTPGDVAANAARHVSYRGVLRVTEKANPLVDSLRSTGALPSNYITKAQAQAAGWQPGKALWNSVPGGQIGGDVFMNTTGVLPTVPGRVWYEADVGLVGSMSRAKQEGTRLLYSDDGLVYVAIDHYATVEFVGRWK
ncbi:ribonuclease [Corallococcus sicarius]|uniref:Ribonuclease n=2 Tax=Corallococcus sicarius TaxID=2316726 RepID=A0A3A8MU74_9BACT|nr:ribonuclease [Corallococcus sicarius]